MYALTTYHESHRPLWFSRGANAVDLFDLVMTNIGSLLQYVDRFLEENFV